MARSSAVAGAAFWARNVSSLQISRFLDCSLKLYDVPKEKRAAITTAVLQMDLHTMALGIIQKTVQQAEKGFEALSEKQI